MQRNKGTFWILHKLISGGAI